MTACVGDTGPFLHLHEIDQLSLLRLFPSIAVPPAVSSELHQYRIDPHELARAAIDLQQVIPQPPTLQRVQGECRDLGLQDADQAVLALALDLERSTILTDDLDLREACRRFGRTPVGTIGILFRAKTAALLDRVALERAIQRLFDESTLHVSPAFRMYVLARLDAARF